MQATIETVEIIAAIVGLLIVGAIVALAFI